MEYYIGTKQECDSYNYQVCLGEFYEQPTFDWWKPVELINGSWAILVHPGYKSNMQIVNQIEIKPTE